MRLLSFDTSKNAVCLCLCQGPEVVYEKKSEAQGAHRQEVASLLIPEIDLAFKQAGWAKGDLDFVVVGVGPGSFTGIRFAVVAARTMCQALDLPLMGVSTLECLAFGQNDPCAVLLGAGKDHVFVQCFEAGARAESGPAYVLAADALSQCAGLVFLADEDAQKALSPPAHLFKPLPAWENIAIIQARIAWARLCAEELAGQEKRKSAGNLLEHDKLREAFPYVKVEPLYLRGPSLTLKKANGNSDKAANAL